MGLVAAAPPVVGAFGDAAGAVDCFTGAEAAVLAAPTTAASAGAGFAAPDDALAVAEKSDAHDVGAGGTAGAGAGTGAGAAAGATGAFTGDAGAFTGDAGDAFGDAGDTVAAAGVSCVSAAVFFTGDASRGADLGAAGFTGDCGVSGLLVFTGDAGTAGDDVDAAAGDAGSGFSVFLCAVTAGVDAAALTGDSAVGLAAGDCATGVPIAACGFEAVGSATAAAAAGAAPGSSRKRKQSFSTK